MTLKGVQRSAGPFLPPRSRGNRPWENGKSRSVTSSVPKSEASLSDPEGVPIASVSEVQAVATQGQGGEATTLVG